MKRRTAVVVAVILGVVLIAGGALTLWLLSRPTGPEATAAAYLSALERGDGPAASALSDQRAANAPPVAFDALAGASEWITDASVGSVARDGTDASAKVSFTLSGGTHDATIGLSNASGAWLVTVAPAVAVVAKSTLGAGIVVGGDAGDSRSGGGSGSPGTAGAGSAGIAMPFDESGSVTIGLLPAVYEVSAAPAGLLEGAASVVAIGPAPIEIALDPVLGEAATAAAQTQFTAYLAACTAPTTTVPSACGIRVPWAADLATLSGLKFRIDVAPALVLAPDGSGFAATGGTLIATATGTTDEGTEASFTYRDTEWALRGGIAFTLDELVLEVW